MYFLLLLPMLHPDQHKQKIFILVISYEPTNMVYTAVVYMCCYVFSAYKLPTAVQDLNSMSQGKNDSQEETNIDYYGMWIGTVD